MSIAPKCDRCGAELHEPGALLFSPPKGASWWVEKFHLCAPCFVAVVGFVGAGLGEHQETQ